MKKILALLLALVMVFALAACGTTEGAETDVSSDDTTVVSSEESTPDVSSQAPTNTEVSSQATVACSHKNIKVIPAVEADCGKEGKTEEKVCNDCGAVVVAGQTIPKDTQHYYTAATADKPATCTVCGATRGTVAAPEAPKAYIQNPTMTMNGATLTFSIDKVVYVENNTKCNIKYSVHIETGANSGTYSWKVDVGHGDVGSLIKGNISGETPALAANATYDGTFETGAVDVIGNVGYKLTFK